MAAGTSRTMTHVADDEQKIRICIGVCVEATRVEANWPWLRPCSTLDPYRRYLRNKGRRQAEKNWLKHAPECFYPIPFEKNLSLFSLYVKNRAFAIIIAYYQAALKSSRLRSLPDALNTIIWSILYLRQK